MTNDLPKATKTLLGRWLLSWNAVFLSSSIGSSLPAFSQPLKSGFPRRRLPPSMIYVSYAQMSSCAHMSTTCDGGFWPQIWLQQIDNTSSKRTQQDRQTAPPLKNSHSLAAQPLLFSLPPHCSPVPLPYDNARERSANGSARFHCSKSRQSRLAPPSLPSASLPPSVVGGACCCLRMRTRSKGKILPLGLGNAKLCVCVYKEGGN